MQSYFVTTALPYANGDLHLGHLVEMIEADIWVRAQRALGHDVVFLSGNDAHGTPIMLHARKNGMQPAEAVSIFHQKHKETIEKYDISFNTFGRTDTPLNRKYCYEFFEKLLAAGVFSEQLIEQFFDPVENMFLPDRFVKGTCPKCGALDQCGDHCDACGATYDPKTLITPYSVITKAAPVLKTVSHLFLNLDQDRAWLKEILPGRIDESVMAKLLEWLDEPLKPWDITRDEPYYGFEIPGRPNQYFYVWFDAPIGYLSLFEQATGHSFASDAMREMVHFIGKDISYFHAIFWLVLLKHAQFPLPKRINVHGFLTLSGQKMSKSRGISCDPNQLVSVMSADCVRYVLAAKMHGKIEDMNFDISEAVQKINSDLVGKSLNILSRCAKLLQTYRHGAFEPTAVQERGLDMEMVANIQSLYHARSYGQVIALVMKEMQSCNEFLTAEAPWTVLKNDPSDHGAWKTL
ncbi:MAG: methionine--tRNA ligase, partial [Gammaproteobacteria bacterium]|nr:methionine--tRNA ligase [Gammaproteobacteria bacterium]